MSPTALGPDYWRLWVASAISNLGDGVAIIAYPWLASTLTRNPIAIAGVMVATRLPWLVFSLPAGVITDRVDRRKLIAGMDALRFLLTAGVALVVLAGESGLPDATDLADGIGTAPDDAGVGLALLYLAALLLGGAEVLRDNAAQTFMPAIVASEQLERANGRLWGVEMVMNSFVGPPLAGLLIGVSLALPFLVDATTFAVSAGLVALIAGEFRPKGDVKTGKVSWRTEIGEGVAWLWRHELLRPMAITLAALNGLASMMLATEVLFAQEVLGLSPAGFGALTISGAVGGVIGSITAARVSVRIGPGASLFFTIIASAVAAGLMAGLPSVPVVFAMFVLISYVAVLWNVITVSLRQVLIPDHLLGRVNSVYRFFSWGVIPVATLLGGILVALTATVASRETALRIPLAVSAVAHLLLYVYARPRLNTKRIEAARAAVDVAPAAVEHP
ncbi:MAG: MFS transporter [Acidimicrobiia bacterium]|nr:MFS transporter [Acidimicrobiia bacterium]